MRCVSHYTHPDRPTQTRRRQDPRASSVAAPTNPPRTHPARNQRPHRQSRPRTQTSGSDGLRRTGSQRRKAPQTKAQVSWHHTHRPSSHCRAQSRTVVVKQNAKPRQRLTQNQNPNMENKPRQARSPTRQRMATHSIRRCPRRSQGIRSEGSRQGCMTTSAHAANVHAAVGSKLAESTIEESAATNFVSWTAQLLVANTSTLVHDVVRASCQPSPMDEFKSNTAHPTARLVLVRHGMLQHKNMARSVPDVQTKSSSPIEPCFVLLAFMLLNVLVAALLQKHTNSGRAKPQKPHRCRGGRGNTWSRYSFSQSNSDPKRASHGRTLGAKRCL